MPVCMSYVGTTTVSLKIYLETTNCADIFLTHFSHLLEKHNYRKKRRDLPYVGPLPSQEPGSPGFPVWVAGTPAEAEVP